MRPVISFSACLGLGVLGLLAKIKCSIVSVLIVVKYDIALTEGKDFTSIFITRESGGSLLHPRAQVSLGLHYPKATPTPSGGNPHPTTKHACHAPPMHTSNPSPRAPRTTPRLIRFDSIRFDSFKRVRAAQEPLPVTRPTQYEAWQGGRVDQVHTRRAKAQSDRQRAWSARTGQRVPTRHFDLIQSTSVEVGSRTTTRSPSLSVSSYANTLPAPGSK